MGLATDPIGRWEALGRPLHALPRWGAILVLVAALLSLAWSAVAVGGFVAALEHSEAEQAHSRYRDIDLYAQIHARVAAGEGYYAAALAEQRAHGYPTRPAVTVRPPTTAWGTALFGLQGWRIVAVLLLFGGVIAWLGALAPGTLAWERIAAAVLLAGAGIGATFERAGLIHELIAGLALTLSLGLYRPNRWWPSLLAAALALAVREIAAAYVVVWLTVAVAERRWRESAALAALLAGIVLALVLHAQAVAAERLPGDLTSPGWSALIGPVMPLAGMARLSPLLLLPGWLAGPLALLPLLGWIGLGGRTGLFATLWFLGFGTAVALFARPENFYWVLLVLPAYFAGLALAPRALADLVRGAAGKT
ncbi:MAG: hypothetical protein B7Z08_01810 [Sphingomonadales bacterium 32-68-7]|nr:MAG: hypothetical protein B7Z33_08005 [Sphingomonadales bacterium 12-68-11]OYX10229.1 MAG: hypothetical protein B7Z08_01810 [Sphingomonadales bacterium 32-68-7]